MVVGRRENKGTPRQEPPPAKTATARAEPNLSQDEGLSKELKSLRRANSKLRRLEKLRTDLTHMIIHDLKGPLAEIIANLNLLQEEPLSPSQRDYLSSAVVGTEELFRRVQNILEVYRLETKNKMIRPALFDPFETTQNVVEKLATQASMRGVSISIDSKDGSHPLFADKDLFTRVLVNLHINAIEHASAGGEINVDLSWSEDARRLQVGVSDCGPGIKKTDRKRIFQKFFTTRNGSAPGRMGLGLAFCKLAVEAHGGKIWVEDGDGPGTRFQFYVPSSLAEDSAERRCGQSEESDR